MIYKTEKANFCVAGGGMAGVCCALSAARLGQRVILCHDRPVLGGNASSEIRMSISGADAFGPFKRSIPLATEAREGGILEEIRLRNSIENPQCSPSVSDLILYDLCRREKNLSLYLNTSVVGAELEGGRITAALADQQSTQNSFRFQAELFADCTGDGRLAFEAGALFREGREDKNLFGETFAPETSDSARLCSTLLIQAQKVPWVSPFTPPPWAASFSKKDLQFRLYAPPSDEVPSLGYGYWWIEYGGLLDTVRENEHIRDHLLALVLGVWDHIKNSDCFPDEDIEHWALSWIGFIPGKRESRRFIGHETITQNHILNSFPCANAIAYGGWPIDLHPPGGLASSTDEPCRQTKVPHVYDIPLGAVVSKNIENLFFAGRNISASHVGFSSTRVMGTCSVIGQGVGTAAAVAAQRHLSAHELLVDPVAVLRTQQLLLQNDAYLIGVRNEDEGDLARHAHVTASSEQQGGEAVLILSGQTRSMHGDNGAAPGRSPCSTHRWMSDPKEGVPCWLQLHWDEPIVPCGVSIVFDTGMHRPLSFSLCNSDRHEMLWGHPQMETVADYLLTGCDEQGHESFSLSIKNNAMRLCRHDLCSAVPIQTLRITVLRTNGLDHARIFEVRVWEKPPEDRL